MRTAILFSGGADTVVHTWWAKTVLGGDLVPLYFDVGQAYAARESDQAARVAHALGLQLQVLRPMQLREDPATAHIELRNAFLILWAATLLEPAVDGVVFGMLRGESPPDKRPPFVRHIRAIVRAQRAATIYGADRPFDLHVPFAHHTKAQMVRWLVQSAGRPMATALLADSVGCFQPQLPMCGACWNCINRWVAWQENALPAEFFAVHPAEALVARLRVVLRDKAAPERRAARVSRAWSRWRWTVECWRQVDRYARAVHGKSARAWLYGAS